MTSADMMYIGAPETHDSFWNLKTNLPTTRRFHTESSCTVLFELYMDMGMYLFVLINFYTLP